MAESALERILNVRRAATNNNRANLIQQLANGYDDERKRREAELQRESEAYNRGAEVLNAQRQRDQELIPKELAADYTTQTVRDLVMPTRVSPTTTGVSASDAFRNSQNKQALEDSVNQILGNAVTTDEGKRQQLYSTFDKAVNTNPQTPSTYSYSTVMDYGRAQNRNEARANSMVNNAILSDVQRKQREKDAEEARIKSNPAYQQAQKYQERIEQDRIDAERKELEAKRQTKEPVKNWATGNKRVTLQPFENNMLNYDERIDAALAELDQRQSALDESIMQRRLYPYKQYLYADDFKANSQFKGADDDYIARRINGQGLYENGAKENKLTETAYDYLDQLTKDEKGIYNYLYNTQGKNAADEFLSVIKGELDKRATASAMDKAYHFGDDSFIKAMLGTGASIVGSPTKSIGAIGATVDKILSNGVNPYAIYNRPSNMISAFRSGQDERLREDVSKAVAWMGDSDAAKKVQEKVVGGASLFNSAMLAGLDSAWNLLVAKGIVGGIGGMGFSEASAILNNPLSSPEAIAQANKVIKATTELSTIIMGAGAVPDAIRDAKERGLSDDQAFTLGIIAGIAEYGTEHWSLENLFNTDWTPTNIRQLLKKGVIQGGFEASEEGFGSIINDVADILVAREKSDWKTRINEYVKQGNSKQKAFEKVFLEKTGDTLKDMAAGFLSTGGTVAGEVTQAALYDASINGIHNKVQSYDQKNGTNLGRNIEDIIRTTSGQNESQWANGLADLVNAMSPVYNGNAVNRARDYLREAVNNPATKSEDALAYTGLADYLQEHRKEISDLAKNKKSGANIEVDVERPQEAQETAPNAEETPVTTETTSEIPQVSTARTEEGQIAAPQTVQTAQETVQAENVAQTEQNTAVENDTQNASTTTQDTRNGRNIFLDSLGLSEESTDADAAKAAYDQVRKNPKFSSRRIGLIQSVVQKQVDTLNDMRNSGQYTPEQIQQATETAKAIDAQLRAYVNPENTQRRINALNAAMKRAGVKANIVVDPGVGANYETGAMDRGSYRESDGTIHLNPYMDTQEAFYGVIAHEVFHKAADGSARRELVDDVLNARRHILEHYRTADGIGITRSSRSMISDSTMGDYVASYADLINKRFSLSDEGRAAIQNRMNANPGLTEAEAMQQLCDENEDAFWSWFGTDKSGGNARDYMREEVAAHFMETLGSQQGEEILRTLLRDNRTALQKFIDAVRKLLKMPDRDIGDRQVYENLVNSYERLIAEESGLEAKTLKGTPNEKTEPREATVSAVAEDGTVLTGELDDGTETKYSLKSWNDTDIRKVRKSLLEAGFTIKEINKWIDDVNSIAAIIANDKERLDYIAAEHQKFMKPNGDYKYTLDASTLCAKRLIYQGTFNKIAHKLGNAVLTPNDLIDLMNMMEEDGYQTPCGICYVESRRRHLSTYAQEWLDGYKGEYIPTLDEVVTTDGLEKLRKDHPQTYTDFVSAMNKIGTNNPKVVQLRTDYRGDVQNMRKDTVEALKRIGGLRIQSFSDFETPHLIDMMQAVLDMSAKHLTGQAYTKVPNFAWVFGATGIKINLSLIGDIDENGNLTFSSTEGMNFDEAMKLRNRYSYNVGTILVGKNDAHILAAMADPRIDFIIPFHKSGWSNEEIRNMKTLQGFEDYTDYQSERYITGTDENGNYTTINLGDAGENAIYPEDYWDYNLSGRENAVRYLNLCKEKGFVPKFSNFLVDNHDGSFSLQPDGSTDGYWKTLIDFKMYDNEGKGAPQQEVVPNINMKEAQRVLHEYEGNANELPSASDEFIDKYVDYYQSKHSNDQETTAPKKKKGKSNDVRFSREVKDSYDYSKSFSDQIDDYKAGKFPEFDTLIVRDTPKVFRDIGLNPLPFTYGQGHLKDALANADGEHLGEAQLKKLPGALENPIAIIDNPNHPGRLLAIIEIPGQKSNTVAAVEIDGTGQRRNKTINSNAITTVYEKKTAITKYLKDAVASEVSGNGGVYYIDKNKTTANLITSGGQFPGITSISDGFVKSISDPNSNVKAKLDNVTESSQFKEWFGDPKKDPAHASKIVNADGTPKVVYHQTGRSFWTFDNSNPVAGARDTETPSGFFFKDNDHDIGIGGKRQIAVYLNMRSPLHFADRTEANAWYCKNIKGYSELQDEMRSAISEIEKRMDELESRMMSEDVEIGSEEDQALEKQWDDILENELKPVEDQYAKQLHEMLNEYFLKRQSKYDGIILDDDGHRIVNGKREDVHTYIVFRPNQIKSATDNIGTFDAENDDIRYSRDMKELDDEYMDAVESGDEKTEQRLVDEAALEWGAETAENGKPLRLYHGTPHFGFTEFKDDYHEVPFIYTSTNSTVSAHYAGDQHYAFRRPIGTKYRTGTDTADIIENAKWVYGSNYRVLSTKEKEEEYNRTREEVVKVADRIDELWTDLPDDSENNEIANAVAWVIDPFFIVRDGDGYNFEEDDGENEIWQKDIDNAVELYEKYREILKEYSDKNRDNLNEKQKKFLHYLLGYDVGDTMIDLEYHMRKVATNEDVLKNDAGNINDPIALKKAMDELHEIGTYELYGNLGDKPFVIDTNGAQFWAIKVPEMGEKYYSTDDISKWAYENGYTGVIMKNIYDYGDKADNYVFFNSSQLKSADPVTYYDDGSPIPISERFNPEEKDIRQSRELGIEEDSRLQEARDNYNLLKAQFVADTPFGDARAINKSAFNDIVKRYTDIFGDYVPEDDIKQYIRGLYEIAQRPIRENDETAEARYKELGDYAENVARKLLDASSYANVLKSSIGDENTLTALNVLYDTLNSRRSDNQTGYYYILPDMIAAAGSKEAWDEIRKSMNGMRLQGFNTQAEAEKSGRKSISELFTQLSSDGGAYNSMFEDSKTATDFEKISQVAAQYSLAREAFREAYETVRTENRAENEADVMQLANDLLYAWGSKATPTVMAKAEQRVQEEREKGRERVQNARERGQQLLDEEKQKGNERLQKEKERGQKRLKEEQEKSQRRADRVRENTEKREAAMEERFDAAYERMRKQYERRQQKAEEKYDKFVEKIRQRDIRTATKALNGQIAKRLKKFNQWLEKPQKENGKHIPQKLRPVVAKVLESVLSGTGDIKLSNSKTMTADQMRQIQQEELLQTRHFVDDLVQGLHGISAADGKNSVVTEMFLARLDEMVKELNDLRDQIKPIEPGEKGNNLTTGEKALSTELRTQEEESTEAYYQYLLTIKNMLDMTMKTLRDENRMISNGKAMDLQTVMEPLKEDIIGRKSLPTATEHRKLFNMMNDRLRNMKFSGLSGDLLFKLLGDNWHDLVMHSFREGQNRQAQHEAQFADMMKELTDGYDFTNAGYNGEFVKLKKPDAETSSPYLSDSEGSRNRNDDSNTFNATRAQIMQLYALWQRPDARRHLENGGACFTNERGQDFIKNTYKVTPELFEEWTSVLTDEEKEIADGIVKFLTEEASEWGNDVSKYVYGYRMYNDDHYFPMDVADYSLNRSNTNIAREPSPLNPSFSHATTKSVKPLSLTNIFDVANDHVRKMSIYNAYAAACNDLDRIVSDQDMNQLLLEKFGNGALDAIKEFIQTTGGMKLRTAEESQALNWRALANFRMNNYKRQAVSWNLSTAVKQGISIVRAANVIDPKYLAAGVVAPGTEAYKEIRDKMQSMSGVAYIKSLGYSDTGFGKTIQQLYDPNALNDSGIIRGALSTSKGGRGLIRAYDKFTDMGMWLAAKADEWTWVNLWNAASKEVQDQNPNASQEELDRLTTQRFNDIIGETQVVDTALDTAPIMRSKMLQVFLPFMNEPTKSLGNLILAADRIKTSGGGKQFAKVLTTTAIANMILEPIITTLFSMWRDEKDDSDKFWESFMEKMFGIKEDGSTNYKSIISSNFFGGLWQYPFIQGVYDAISNAMQNYDNTSIDNAAIIDTAKAAMALFDNAGKSPSERMKTQNRLWRDFIEQMAADIGIPAKTIRRQLSATARSVMNAVGANELKWEYQKLSYNLENSNARSQKGFYDILARTYMDGDLDTYQKMMSELNEIVSDKSTLIDEKSLRQAIEKRGAEVQPGTEIWNLDVQSRFRLDQPVKGWKVENFVTGAYVNAQKAGIDESVADDVLLNMPDAYEYTDEDGEEVKMSPGDYLQYAADVGQLSYKTLSEMSSGANSKLWSSLNADQKVVAIRDVYKYCKAKFKKDYNEDYDINHQGKWMTALYDEKATPAQIAKAALEQGAAYDKELKRTKKKEN